MTSFPTNSDRAAWAGEALLAFCHRTGGDYEDALCDLRSALRPSPCRGGEAVTAHPVTMDEIADD